MGRRREVPKRKILPDPKYHDRIVAKFINAMMKGGKKSTAEGICYGAFQLMAERAPAQVAASAQSLFSAAS